MASESNRIPPKLSDYTPNGVIYLYICYPNPPQCIFTLHLTLIICTPLAFCGKMQRKLSNQVCTLSPKPAAGFLHCGCIHQLWISPLPQEFVDSASNPGTAGNGSMSINASMSAPIPASCGNGSMQNDLSQISSIVNVSSSRCCC